MAIRVVLNKFNRKEVRIMLFAPKEKGQGLVEYALILVLVAIVVIAVLMLLGPIIGNVFSTINSSLSGVG
jgi:pilus assembly protein Flp/PilA